MPIKTRLEHALFCAYEAEKIILGSYQDPRLRVALKEDKTIVTETDLATEKRLRELIENVYPEDGIIGEEQAARKGTSGYEWVLDPIDGTDAFAAGVPLFGTLIGILFNGVPVAGAAHLPALKETYYAWQGGGAWWRPAAATTPLRAQVSSVATMKEALFLTTSHAGFERAGRRALFEKLQNATRKFRGWGSCYGHLLVATGRAEIMIDPSVKLWDCAAISPIVTEAGGRFFDIKGEDRIDGGSAVSTTANLAAELTAFLASDAAARG